ncbi:D-alanyl-D-alanine carboxypeptidase [Nakamurella sp. A5-74]|uniref:D-alanyl-D-alanine carboxypeptidase n=1 Tax=Nakamurella sp. A5-74 TaxID=3158264 RepID=A0AAU8DNN5_9ACTN
MTETLRPIQHPRPARATAMAPTAGRTVRDELFRSIALWLGRVLLPSAWLGSRHDSHARAAQWALQLRFPHERLAGLTTGMAVALRRARTAAFWEQDLLLGVTSGHRTVDEQNRMLTDDLIRLESVGDGPARALPVEQSQHVAGLAVDVRPREAAMWLERNGHRFDLYRTYANEWWHFEYLPRASGTAPQMLAHPGARGPGKCSTTGAGVQS